MDTYDENAIEDYESGPYCQHWSDPVECDVICEECGVMCRIHKEVCREEDILLWTVFIQWSHPR